MPASSGASTTTPAISPIQNGRKAIDISLIAIWPEKTNETSTSFVASSEAIQPINKNDTINCGVVMSCLRARKPSRLAPT